MGAGGREARRGRAVVRVEQGQGVSDPGELQDRADGDHHRAPGLWPHEAGLEEPEAAGLAVVGRGHVDPHRLQGGLAPRVAVDVVPHAFTRRPTDALVVAEELRLPVDGPLLVGGPERVQDELDALGVVQVRQREVLQLVLRRALDGREEPQRRLGQRHVLLDLPTPDLHAPLELLVGLVVALVVAPRRRARCPSSSPLHAGPGSLGGIPRGTPSATGRPGRAARCWSKR